MTTDRKALFQQVAVTMLTTRSAAVIRGSAEGNIVCSHFLKDVALVTEAILKSSEEFQNVRTVTKEAVDAIIENHRELISKLVDRPEKTPEPARGRARHAHVKKTQTEKSR